MNVRLIDADAARENVRSGSAMASIKDETALNLACEIVDAVISECDTIDAEPVRHGRWMAPYRGRAACSACAQEQEVEMFVGNPTQKYCARCGAKMDESEVNKDE